MSEYPSNKSSSESCESVLNNTEYVGRVYVVVRGGSNTGSTHPLPVLLSILSVVRRIIDDSEGESGANNNADVYTGIRHTGGDSNTTAV